MRVDANVSVRRPGEPCGTRCEIKNVNSLRSLVRAIEYEAPRQVDVIDAGERVRQETRHWDEAAGRTLPGRDKEEAEDYRYFPEPDLVPVVPDPAWIAEIAAALPVLPAERRARLADAAGVARPTPRRHRTSTAASTSWRSATIAARRRPGPRAHPRRAQPGGRRGRARVRPELRRPGRASRSTASSPPPRPRRCWPRWSPPAATPTPRRSPRPTGFEAMDAADLEAVVDGVIAAHPDDWSGSWTATTRPRGKLTGFFVGQVMKATAGKADGKAVTALLNQRAAAAGGA